MSYIYTLQFKTIYSQQKLIKMVKELLITAAAVAIGVIVASMIQKKFLKSDWEESYEAE